MCLLLDRILMHTRENENGCWEWTGSRNKDGYGKVSFAGSDFLAHRLVYEAIRGDLPDELVCDHLCRNRACVNPGHIELVTLRENNLRGEGLSAINAAKTHCPQGHPYNEANTRRPPSGGRQCRACGARKMRKHRQKLAEAELEGVEQIGVVAV